ncbi:MAG: protein translocase subunit SecD [Oscillospiraceae bacterium]|jgi:SecD/SecF fusion protein|nr:protein translocase subunit SecD [Oscillospiraceae bacterium]
MKKTTIGILAIVIVVAVLVWTAFVGIDPFIRPLNKGIKQGLDLVGGSEITYKAIIPGNMSQTDIDSGMDAAITMLRQRLNSLGYTEANVYRQTSNNAIVLEVPDVEDPQEAVSMLGATAVVEFRDYQGNVVLDGKDIESASARQEESNQTGMIGWIVQMELSDEGYEKFKEGTKIAAQQESGNNYVEIFLDDESISKPSVDAQYAATGIESKSPIIELGNSDRDYAVYLAEIIKAGSLPFTLETGSLRHIGAQLGEDSLDSAILAGIIGIILVMIYMLVFYRMSGLVADIALCVYILLFMVTMSAIGINLTLPGIAGLVLTVGMAVDANIIIYERLREELRNGRTLKGAIEAGFKRALGAILDGNITTLIAAIVLLWQGTGTILSFAKTLTAGVILSMLCMLIIPRLLLTAIASGGVSNPNLFAILPKKTDGERKPFSFVKAFRVTGIVSVALVVTAVAGLVLLPFGTRIMNLDHDFIGGVTMDIDIGETVNRDISAQIEETAAEVLGFAPSSISQSGNSGTTVTLKMRDVPSETWDAIYLAVAEQFGGTEKVTLVSCEAISPSVGRDITSSAFIATILAAILILLYIAVRFEFRSGIAAIIALIHDVLVVLSFYIAFQIPMNMNFIAAILTVVGYSINATIVIFDRIRENNKRSGGQTNFAVVVDRSIKETIRRSIGTTITTLAPLVVLIILSVSSVRNFGIPIVIGLIVGCYSSMFLTGPLWNALRGKKVQKA